MEPMIVTQSMVIISKGRIISIGGIISKVVGVSIGLWSWFSIRRSLAIVVVMGSSMVGIVGPGSWLTVVQQRIGIRLGESQSDNGKECLKINVMREERHHRETYQGLDHAAGAGALCQVTGVSPGEQVLFVVRGVALLMLSSHTHQ